MAQSLRQIKARIRSVENVKKITRAMEMISVAKFKAAENKLFTSALYTLKIEKLLKDLLSCAGDMRHPLFEKRKDESGAKKIGLCVIASDSGLCGSFNNNIIRLAEKFINERGGKNITLIVIGKKGFNYFRKRGLIPLNTYVNLRGRYSEEVSGEVLKVLTGLFLSKEADEIYVAYTCFESNARHKPVIEKFLNIEAGICTEAEYIFEPGINSILDELLPIYLSNKMKFYFLNSFTSEHAARMNAMGESTQNAKELLEALILSRNKVRQTNITQDLIEISSAAETLM